MQQPVLVTIDNFLRAETDRLFAGVVNDGGFGKFRHRRCFAPLDEQPLPRMNRDTFYSAGVFDLDAGPVTITTPDPGARFLSMQVFDQEEYTPFLAHGAGSHTLTRETIPTRYAGVVIRIFVDSRNPLDVAAVHALQDAIIVRQHGIGMFEIPQWDIPSQKRVREMLRALGETIPDSRRAFGARGQVDPMRHLIGAARGWGGNPEREALYINVTPANNDGKSVYRLHVKDVPTDAFWSVSVYNALGYFEKNSLDAYSINSITGKRNSDGSMTIQFGGCDGKAANCLPIMRGWNYTVRIYRPRPEALSGAWVFPEAELMN